MRKLLNATLIGMMLAVSACDTSTPTPTGVAQIDPRASGGGGGGGGSGGGGGGGGTTGSGGGTTTLTFLQAAPGAPAIGAPISFYAVQGQDKIVEVNYVTATSGNPSRRFIRFRIRSRTQIIRPDGTPLVAGDSIQITISVADPVAMIAQFEPSGLVFSGKDPATLTMSYSGADHDFNHDGVINTLDANIEKSLSIYRQEANAPAWFRVTGALDQGLDEISATVPGFSNYVIAY